MSALLPSCLVAFLAAPQQETPPAPSAPPAPSVDQQVAEAAACLAAAADDSLARRASGMARSANDGGRAVLDTDFGARDAKRMLALADEVLAQLDAALGAPLEAPAAPLWVVMIKRRKSYEGLCEALAAADPTQAAYFENARRGTGFTLYRPLLSVAFHDPKVQKEARPDHAVAHNLVHLELARRYGELPLWLKEGIACAGEEAADGEVWAPWYRDSFVFAKSHGAWRERALELAPQLAGDPGPLFHYSARPYDDDLAHQAFAFAAWALAARPDGLRAFLESLRADYAEHAPAGGRFQAEPERVMELAAAAFGPAWAAELAAWWAPPDQQRRARRPS